MTSRSLPLVSLLRLAPGLLLLLAAGCSTSDPTPKTATPAAPVAEGAFDDDAHAPTAIESAMIAAGKDPAKLAAVERDLLAKMQDPKSSPVLVQEAGQHLGYVMQAGASGPNPATLAVLAPMLSDPAKVDYARLALDRVPGEAVDALYLQALPGATGRVRLALIGSAAARNLTAAVPLLAPWLNDADPALATAAAQALGRIGGPPALAALDAAKSPLTPVVLNARLAAASKIDATTVARVAGEIHRNPAAPLPQRSAALRQLINADPAKAVEEIHSALSGTEPAFHAVAIHAVSTLQASGAAEALAGRLGSYAPAVQAALLAALGIRNDAGAIPGLLKVLDGADADARLAAIEALGRLPGSTGVAERLARLAAGSGAEAKAAFASLARLNGPGLDEFIQAGAADDGDAARQTVFVQQLAARNQTEAIPFLLGLRGAPAEALRLEALDALRAIAGPLDQRALVYWALGTSAKAEQNRAVRALITLILRDGNVDTRANTVIAAINAGDASARQILLPVLSRVAGAPALAAAGQLARNPDATVAKAATAELSRWPDASALPVLVDLVASTADADIRASAVQGAARFLAERANATPAQRSLYCRQLLDLPLDASARVALLNVLSLCSDQTALDTARRFVADPATAAAAQGTAEAITSNLAGPPVFAASEAADKTALMLDGRRNSYWAVPNAPGGWLRLDLHNSRPVRKIILDQGRREWDWPDRLDVCISDNPDKPGEPVTQQEGEREKTIVTLPPGSHGRYVWLRQVGTRPGNPWAVAELVVE